MTHPRKIPKRRANHRADGETESAAAEREKDHLSGEECRMIKAAVNHGAAIPADSRREVLMGYHYALHQQKKQLLREKSEIRRRHESASTTSKVLREERSNASYTGGGRHREPN
jgi:hypothetical protein